MWRDSLAPNVLVFPRTIRGAPSPRRIGEGMSMYDPRSRYRPLRFFTEPLVWLLASLMIGLALLSFALAWRDEQLRLDARLNSDATEITRLIEDTMTENERSLLTTRALFAASHTTERTTFSEFVTPLLERLARTQAIGWAPRVPATERVAFERSVQATGVPDFMLYERNTNGQRVPTSGRPEYFPATFIEPFALNREAIGFDLGSDSSRLQTLARARDTGQPALTPPIHLVQTTDENYGLLLILAVYRQDAPTDSLIARRENLLGVVYSRFQMSALLEKARSQLNPRDIELYMFDVSDAQPQLLVFHPSHSGAQVLPAGAPPDLASLAATLHASTQFENYGRTWQIVARPGPAYVAASHSWDAWSRLIIGLISAVVFLLYIYTRKRADGLLRQSQARLELAQAVAQLGSWELDLATGRGVWSQEMYRLFQRDPTTPPPVFEEFLQTVHPEDRAVVQAALRHAGATGERVTVEHRNNAPPDAVRHFEVTVHTIKNAQGRPLRLAGAVHDITARTRSEARLRRLNRTYALQSEINQTIVRVRDLHELFATTCQIVVAQGAFCMAWIGRPDPQTRRVYPVAHAGVADGYLDKLSIVVDDSADRDAYAAILHAGAHVVVNDIVKDLRMGPWRDAAQRLGYRASAIFPLMVAGKVYGALNLYAPELNFFDADELKLLDEIATDIAFAIEFIEQDAQRRLAEEKLRASEEALIAERNSLARRVEERTADLSRVNTELSRAVRAKDEFLANMSHELRTPLNAILGLSEGLLEQFRGPLNERQQESLRNIEISGRHLLALINDILDLAKVESGRMEVQLDPVLITELCESSLLFVKAQALKKHLHLVLQLDDRRAMMHADAKRLKQMLVNLLSNAVKFTEAGGRVSLEVQTDAEAGVVRFSVEDTGIGMSPEGMARLFQPFIQLDSRLSRQYEGSGLGLALVRRLARLHGGSVTVASELGQGSRFTIALPYRSRELMAQNPADHALTVGSNAPHAVPSIENTESAREAASIPPPHAQPPAGVRVLMVEDNPINSTTIGAYLHDRGYHVVAARNGREALDIVAEARPDVILMDIQMPEMDGLETTRHLRAMPAYQHTPIIALTALAMPGDRERCLAAGANEYLTKPVRLKGLVETMQRLL